MIYNYRIPDESELEEGEVIMLPNLTPNFPNYSPPRDDRKSSSSSTLLKPLIACSDASGPRGDGDDTLKQSENSVVQPSSSQNPLEGAVLNQEKDSLVIDEKTLTVPSIQQENGVNLKKVRKARGGKRKKRQRNKENKKVIKIFVPVCKFYLDGRCAKGAACEFRHEGELNKKNEPCKFYIRDGSCYRGKECAYMHGEFPCKFYYWGNCKSDPCRFFHGSLSKDQEKILMEHIAKSSQPPSEVKPEPTILDPKEYTSASIHFFRNI